MSNVHMKTPNIHVKEEFKSKQFTFEIGPEGSKKTKKSYPRVCWTFCPFRQFGTDVRGKFQFLVFEFFSFF